MLGGHRWRRPWLLPVVMVAVVGAAVAADWQRIDGPPELDFPRDHGAHPTVRTEWWYLTANVADGDGRRFGVQITFFRQGVDPAAATPDESPLRAHHVIAAHLAVADIDDGRFRHAERLRRANGGFAGFSTTDLEVWLGDWTLSRGDADVLTAQAGDREAGIAADLRFRPLKPIVRQGEGGWSRKGPDPGNASAYVSWTRLAVEGSLRLDGRDLQVAGEGWFDHEWGTSQLGDGVVGWDWFSLRFDDGSELMLYRLRRADGTVDPFSSATLVTAKGETRRLAPDEVALEPTGSWTSPTSGATYPSGWRVAVPLADLMLEIQPELVGAELDARTSTGTIYWEGPVTVSGNRSGEGYAELTGYATSLADRF